MLALPQNLWIIPWKGLLLERLSHLKMNFRTIFENVHIYMQIIFGIQIHCHVAEELPACKLRNIIDVAIKDRSMQCQRYKWNFEKAKQNHWGKVPS